MQILRAALFSWLGNLALQAIRVAKHETRNDFAFSKLEDGNALIVDLPSCAGKAE
jgi:hypothetical protein